MRKLDKNRNSYIVDSQPGDGTHYSFVLTRSKEWGCWFVGPFESNMPYPAKVEDWYVADTRQKDVTSIAAEYKCNPWTVAEVFRAIKTLNEEETDIPGFEVDGDPPWEGDGEPEWAGDV